MPFSGAAIGFAAGAVGGWMVKGADKAETLRDVLEGEFQLEKLPSQNVKPINGNLFWLCDSESARFLKFENS